MRRLSIGVGVALILALALTLVLTIGQAGVEIAGRLILGWTAYLGRVGPQVTVSRDGLITGVGCLVLFTGGLHVFLRWLRREVVPSGVRPWKFRWTASIVMVVVSMFVAGIAATGLTHQVGWLASSRRPHFVPRIGSETFGYFGDSISHLKQIGLAIHNYGSSYESLPTPLIDPQGRPLQSWQTPLLHFMPIWHGGQIHDDLPWNDPKNSAYFRGIVMVYLNPDIGPIRSPEGYALSHYAGNRHLLENPAKVPFDQLMAESGGTIIVGEVAAEFKPWGDSTNLRDPDLGINKSPEGFGHPTSGGANFLFLDGSVRMVKDSVDPKVLYNMGHPKGGQIQRGSP